MGGRRGGGRGLWRLGFIDLGGWVYDLKAHVYSLTIPLIPEWGYFLKCDLEYTYHGLSRMYTH